jgi:RNA polymerase subunit RPABC4/transcription elongation factor Spt4
MKTCPKCNRTYPDEAPGFCPQDGTPLTPAVQSSINCQKCGYSIPPDAPFCANCGSPKHIIGSNPENSYPPNQNPPNSYPQVNQQAYNSQLPYPQNPYAQNQQSPYPVFSTPANQVKQQGLSTRRIIAIIVGILAILLGLLRIFGH